MLLISLCYVLFKRFAPSTGPRNMSIDHICRWMTYESMPPCDTHTQFVGCGHISRRTTDTANTLLFPRRALQNVFAVSVCAAHVSASYRLCTCVYMGALVPMTSITYPLLTHSHDFVKTRVLRMSVFTHARNLVKTHVLWKSLFLLTRAIS